MSNVAKSAEDAAHQVQRQPAYRALVKVGVVAYGLMHLVIAWLALRVAFGDHNADASNTGALKELAQTPLGGMLLWIVGVGFIALVVWQLVAGFVGYREFDGGKRLRKRLGAFARAVLYAVLAASSIATAIGGGSGGGGGGEESLTSRLMSMPFGPWLVVAIGLGIVAVGVAQIVKGVSGKFNEELETELTGTPRWLAGAGWIAKGVAISLIGGLFVAAAIAHDPEEAGGMDEALTALTQQPFGVALLVVLAVGIGCFAFWCWHLLRHAKHA
ncbi:DUF1206 domain-containing protein [Gulosibacter sp. ACHW.36C]|uniref:DUF1206 domain-containing protein n=1 Tax=Gulosibacter sediminis TaxID=1729695 RepID=A0ABY4N1I8_9MICO|nr:DUF1206 domain-containing protein [Gulosibacter sediminis]UQN15322.1 DUF1206 domain-containing protein [Gulosibacter sediminis]